jgi:nitroreductase
VDRRGTGDAAAAQHPQVQEGTGSGARDPAAARGRAVRAFAGKLPALPAGSLQYWIARIKAKLFGRLQPNLLHPVPVSAATVIAQGRFAVLHRAPTLIVILMDKRGIGVPAVDVGICGTNIVLAAQSLGLGTCWVGFSKFLNESPEWCERLGVEQPYEVAEAITVGYPVGDTTHLVPRETHETAWFEGGKKQVVF